MGGTVNSGGHGDAQRVAIVRVDKGGACLREDDTTHRSCVGRRGEYILHGLDKWMVDFRVWMVVLGVVSLETENRFRPYWLGPDACNVDDMCRSFECRVVCAAHGIVGHNGKFNPPYVRLERRTCLEGRDGVFTADNTAHAVSLLKCFDNACIPYRSVRARDLMLCISDILGVEPGSGTATRRPFFAAIAPLCAPVYATRMHRQENTPDRSCWRHTDVGN